GSGKQNLAGFVYETANGSHRGRDDRDHRAERQRPVQGRELEAARADGSRLSPVARGEAGRKRGRPTPGRRARRPGLRARDGRRDSDLATPSAATSGAITLAHAAQLLPASFPESHYKPSGAAQALSGPRHLP